MNSGKQALNESELRALLELLNDYVSTKSLMEGAEYLSTHPQLLTPLSLQLLDALVDMQVLAGDQDSLAGISGRRRFLQLCIEHGVSKAIVEAPFWEKLFGLVMDFCLRYTKALLRGYNTGGTDDSVDDLPVSEPIRLLEEDRRSIIAFIAKNPELLKPEVDRIFEDVIAHESDDGMRVHLRGAWQALSNCRLVGIEEALGVAKGANEGTHPPDRQDAGAFMPSVLAERGDLGKHVEAWLGGGSSQDLMEAFVALNSDLGEDALRGAVMAARDELPERDLLAWESQYRQFCRLRKTFALLQADDVDVMVEQLESTPSLWGSETKRFFEDYLHQPDLTPDLKARCQAALTILARFDRQNAITLLHFHELWYYLGPLWPWSSDTTPSHFTDFLWSYQLEDAHQVLLTHLALLTIPSELLLTFGQRLKECRPAWSALHAHRSCLVLERLDLLLRSKISIESAFRYYEAVESSRRELWPVVHEFVYSHRLSDAQRYLTEHSELLTDDALVSLSTWAGGASIEGDELEVQRFSEYYDLLHQCDEVGASAAFAHHTERMIAYYRIERLAATTENVRAAMQCRLGWNYHATGKRDLAILAYEDALKFYNPVDFSLECYELAGELSLLLMDAKQYDRAMETLTIEIIAADIASQSGRISKPFQSLVQRAEFLYDTCLHWSTNPFAYLQKSIEMANRAAATRGKAALYLQAGGLHRLYGNRDLEIASYNEAVKLLGSQADSYRHTLSMMYLARVEQEAGNLDRARDLYSDALAQNSILNEPDQRCDLLLALGSIAYQEKHFDEANRYLQQAYEGYGAQGVRFGQAGAAFQLSMVFNSQDNFTEAIKWLETARTLVHDSASESRAMDRDTGEYRTVHRDRFALPAETLLTTAGVIDFAVGRYQEALDSYHQALQIVRDRKDQSYEASILCNLGAVHSQLGQHDLAVEMLRTSVSLARNVGDPRTEATALENLGVALFAKGDLQEAIEVLESSQHIHEELDNASGLILTLSQLANCHHADGRVAVATDLQRRAFDLAREIGAINSEASCLINLALYELQQGHLLQAKTLYREALSITTDTGDVSSRVRCLRALGSIAEQLESYEEAWNLYHEAVLLTEEMRGQLVASAHRAGAVEKSQLYRAAFWAGIKVGEFEAAFEILELSKARWLADQLFRRDLLPPTHPRYEEYVRAFDMLDASYGAYLAKEAGWLAMPLPTDLSASTSILRVEAAQKEFARVVDQLREEDDLHMLPGVNPHLVQIDNVRSTLLTPARAVVQLAVGETETVALIVMPEQEHVQCVRLPGLSRGYLELLLGGRYGSGRVGYWMTAYARRTQDNQAWLGVMSAVIEELAELFWAPLGPILKQSSVSQLVLVPDGPLFMLPLHAARLSPSTDALVLERYCITYTPSYGIYMELTAHQKPPSPLEGRALVVGNPTGDLPLTAVEAMAVRQVVGSDRTRVLVGEQATADEFLSNAGLAQLIHFAGHASHDWGSPWESSLHFSDRDGQGQLNLASMRYRLRLGHARLLVLSACESNALGGAEVPVEEYMSLPGTAILAGTPAVIGTLWPVKELPSILLMHHFYRELYGSDPDSTPMVVAEALRRAQLWLRSASKGELLVTLTRMRQNLIAMSCFVEAHLVRQAMAVIHVNSSEQPFAHPYHWAGFQAVGATLS